jgi:hypothetical protein
MKVWIAFLFCYVDFDYENSLDFLCAVELAEGVGVVARPTGSRQQLFQQSQASAVSSSSET